MFKKVFPLFTTVFIDTLSFGLVIPVLAPIFLNETGGFFAPGTPNATRTLVLGVLLALYPFVQFFAAPYLGALADKYGRKKVLVFSLMGTFLSYVLLGFGIYYRNLYLLLIARVFDGFTGANQSSVYSAISDITQEHERPKFYGIIGVATAAGYILGPYIGGKLSDPKVFLAFSYETPFIFAAVLCLINVIFVKLIMQETLTNRNYDIKVHLFDSIYNLRKAFLTKGIRVLFFITLLTSFGFNFFTQFFPVYLVKRFGMAQGDIGDFFAYLGICVAIIQGLGTYIISKYVKPAKVIYVSMLLLTISYVCIVIPEKATGLYITIPFLAMFLGLTDPNLTTLLSSHTDESSQGRLMGIRQSVLALAQTIPPIIAGFSASIHFASPIILAALTTVIGWFILSIKYNNIESLEKVTL